MLSQNRIEQIYKTTRTALDTVYKKRKRALLLQRIMWGIIPLYFVLFFPNWIAAYFPSLEIPFLNANSAFGSNPYNKLYIIFGIMAIYYPVIYISWKSFQTLKIKENNTVTRMVKQLFPTVDFIQNITAPINQIVKSKLFVGVQTDTPVYNYGMIRKKTDTITVNVTDIGLIEDNSGRKLSNLLIQIPFLNSLLMLYQYVFKNMFTSKTSDNTQYTFRGMFCWLQFKKSLRGHTVVLPKSNSTKFDRFLEKNFKEEQRIQLEDPRFTDSFLIYSTDQVEARYILSMALMERILLLKQKFERPILLSFQDKEMYLAVQNPHGLFTFPSGKLDDIKIVEELANDIDTALEVATILKIT
ncbi:DUF3137 domain-containing protein [Aquimarina sp. M1]